MTTTVDASATPEAAPTPPVPSVEPGLPLEQLDGFLDPLRRTLAFAMRAGQPVPPRFLGANGQRWLRPALALDLPNAVRDMMVDMAGQLAGFDECDAETQVTRTAHLFQLLTRLDALLGLPIRRRRRLKAAKPLPKQIELPPPAPEPKPKAEPKAAAEPKASKAAKATSKASESAKAGATPEASDDEEELSVDFDDLLLADDAGASSSPSKGRGRRGRGRDRDRGGRDRDRGRGRGRGRGRRDDPVEETPPPPPKPTPGNLFLYDPQHLGRALDDMGLPDALLAALKDAGLERPIDLLLTPPSGEELVRPVHGAGREIEPGRAAVGGRVRSRFTRLQPDGGRRTELVLKGAGPLRVRWSRAVPPWMLERLGVGERVVLVGTYAVDGDTPVLLDPELGTDDGHHGVRLAEYGIAGVDDSDMRALVSWLLPEVDRLREPIPGDVLKRYGLPPLSEAIRAVHTQGEARPEARNRFGFEESMLVTLAHGIGPRVNMPRGIGHTVSHSLAARLCQYRDITTNDAQQVAFESIKRDLRSGNPMVRLLAGDAGAGKGLVATLTALTVAEAKNQVLFLSPDETTSAYRHLFIEPLLRESGLVGRLFTGEVSAGQKDAIRRGEVHIIFGTHDLLDADIEYKKLGLVISEETQNLGATTRRLNDMTPRPDLLVVSPVPVPGMAMLAAYADHDISAVPVERRHAISGEVYAADDRGPAYAKALEAVKDGRQALVVFPMVDGRDALDAREAMRVKGALESEYFVGMRVSLFHGAMTREERYRVVDDFAHHRSDVLVATAPIELAPPMPAVSCIVFEQSDRLRARRLYRLRGLLQHSGVPEDCACFYVLGSVPDEKGEQWVRTVASAPAGKDAIMQELMEQGIESLLGEGANDAPSLTWLDPRSDRNVLLAGHREARFILKVDPLLRRGNHADIVKLLRDAGTELLGDEVEIPEQGQQPRKSGRRRRRRRKKR